MASRRDDIELMQLFDGELSEGELTSLSEEDRLKLESMAQVGEIVRGHLELAADEVDARLDGMWAAIERGVEAPAAEPAASHARAVDRSPARDDGLFTRIGQWLDRHRGHVFTGAACAAAAAALVIVLRPPRTIVHTELVQVPAPALSTSGQTFASQPAVVEDLDVSDGSGMVLTIPGEEGENPTTVIWVTRDDMEGPI